MNNAGTIRTKNVNKRHRWFGVWGIPNYYHKLELQAKVGSEIDTGYFLLVITSALIATAGLLANNAVVIIGSMCIAPFLGPSRSVSIGGFLLEKKIFWQGLFKQLFGLFIVGGGLAYLLTIILINTTPKIEITQQILLRALPDTKDFILNIIIAIAAGAGASLAFTADPHVVDEPWGQLLDVMIGVEIAISLIPPASVIGIGFAFQDMAIVRNASFLLVINVISLDILGSMLIFILRGMRRRYFDLERTMHQIVETELENISDACYENSVIDVTLLSKENIRIQVTLRGHTQEIPHDFAQSISHRVLNETKCKSEVLIELMPCHMYSTNK